MHDLGPEIFRTNQNDQLRHLVNLIRARLTLQQNLRDGALGQPNAAIKPIYLVDSNVLHLFFNPEQNYHLVQLFRHSGALSQVQAETAIITGQFLFSGHLPGQRLLPLFLDPGHLLEFRQGLSATLRALNASAQAVAQAEGEDEAHATAQRFRRRVGQIKQQLERAKSDPDALRKLSESHLPRLIADFDLGVASAARQLLSLAGSDRIRPLRLAPGVDRSIVDRPNPETVEHWEDLLTRAERAAPNWTPNSPNARTKNRHRDAECLARIEQINLENHRQDRPERLHLITSDEVIHAAVALEGDQTGVGMVEVRRTSQYLPVFNTEDIDNRITRPDATRRLRDAIDIFLRQARRSGEDRGEVVTRLYNRTRILQQIEGDIRAWLAAAPEHEREARARRIKALVDDHKTRSGRDLQEDLGPLMGDGLTATLPSIERHWTDLAQNAVHLNMHLVVKYHEDLLGDIEDAFESLRRGDTAQIVAQIYEDKQIRISSNLAKSHLQTTMRNALIQALGSLNRRASLTFSTRAPQTLIGRRGRALPSRIVHDAWDNAHARLREDIKELCQLDAPDFRDVQLGCAAVALQLGAWSTTANIAERLIGEWEGEIDNPSTGPEAPPPEPMLQRNLGDAHFLRASSLRAMVWTDYNSIQEGQDGVETLGKMLRAGRLHLRSARTVFEATDDALGRAQVHAARATHQATRLLLAAVARLDPKDLDPVDLDWDDTGGERPAPLDLASLASKTVFYARQTLDAGADPRLDGLQDLAGRDFSTTLRAKASVAAVLCRLAVRHLNMQITSFEAIEFDRFHDEIKRAIASERRHRLRFDVWKVILKLSQSLATKREGAARAEALEVLSDRLASATVSPPEENLEIAFLLEHADLGTANA